MVDLEYQNVDLWGLWGGGMRTHPVHPPGYGPGLSPAEQTEYFS